MLSGCGLEFFENSHPPFFKFLRSELILTQCLSLNCVEWKHFLIFMNKVIYWLILCNGFIMLKDLASLKYHIFKRTSLLIAQNLSESSSNPFTHIRGSCWRLTCLISYIWFILDFFAVLERVIIFYIFEIDMKAFRLNNNLFITIIAYYFHIFHFILFFRLLRL